MTEPSILPKTAWWLIAAAVIAVPLFVGLHGSDNFRLPKDSLFMAFGLALAVILVARIVAGATRLRTVPIIALTAVLWTAITTALSVNRAISVRTLLWVIAAAAFAMAIDFAARERSRLVIALPLIPAAINAVIFLLQRFHVWNPMRFPDDLPDHFRFTALIGNPDDVGSFLVAPAIVAVALLMTDRARRALWLPVAALLITAIVTGRLTSLIAFGAALLAIGFMRSRRMGIVTTVAVIVATVLLFMAYQPLRKRASEIATAMRLGEYATASAGRVTPFLAAANMARDHPLFGVGPGCFGFEYYPYKIAVERAHPSLTTAYATNFNYGETHNDHLQTLAETGVIGYAIFLVAIIVLARSSQSEDDIVRTTAFRSLLPSRSSASRISRSISPPPQWSCSTSRLCA